MQVISLAIGILSMLGFLVGFVPCLGSLNWLNIPFAAIGLAIGLVALSKSPRGGNGAAITGVVLCAIAVGVGMMRLWLGGGVF